MPPSRETTDDAGTGSNGPHLVAALICERVMVEQDGVKTAFRIVDRITHTKIGPNPPEKMPPFNATLAMLVKLKSGDYRGSRDLVIRLSKPDGVMLTPVSQRVQFEGSDQGIDFMGNVQLRFEQEGIYWFDIFLDDELLTRTPVRIFYYRRIQQTGETETIQ